MSQKELTMNTNDENNKFILDLERSTELLIKLIPGMMYSYYKKLCEEGFSKKQSFQLARDYQDRILCNGVTNNG